jgi:hypothetical protein
MMQYTIHPLAWFVVVAVLMSFIEHQIHRRLMHRKNIAMMLFEEPRCCAV